VELGGQLERVEGLVVEHCKKMYYFQSHSRITVSHSLQPQI
jgi:hypothetical protein